MSFFSSFLFSSGACAGDIGTDVKEEEGVGEDVEGDGEEEEEGEEEEGEEEEDVDVGEVFLEVIRASIKR